MALQNVTPIRLTQAAQSQLSNTSRLLYTCPADSYVKISAATCTNTTNTDSNVTLHLVGSGAPITTSSQLVSGQTVPANGSYIAVELLNHILTPGDQIWGSSATASAINFHASGVQFS